MEQLSMCRICLASDVRLCSLARHLQDMYEKLTSMTFKREDNRPLAACYICVARLRNCYRLRTNCLQSEELLTQMQNSGVLVPQELSSTNTLRVVSVLNLSLGPGATECHVKEESPGVIHNTELDQQNTEDIKIEAQEDHDVPTDDDLQCSHSENPLDVVKREPYDIETDIKIEAQEEHDVPTNDDLLCSYLEIEVEPEGTVAEDATLEAGNIIQAEIKEEPGVAGPSSLSTETLKRMAPDNTRIVAEDATLEAGNIIQAEIKEEPGVAGPSSLSTETLKRMAPDNTRIGSGIKRLEEIDFLLEMEPENVKKNKKVNTSKGHLECRTRARKEDKQFQCDVCNKWYSGKECLKRHLFKHTGVKPHVCEVCKKCFTLKALLVRHVRTHTGEKPYVCDICKKCYAEKANLNNHVRTHTGERPFMCAICRKCFALKSILKGHVRTHTGEKPFKCDVCNKCFKEKSSLRSHIRTHTGEKPHMCEICKKCFAEKSTLITHVRIHTSDKPYFCVFCKKAFTQKSTLKKHVCKHTGDKSKVAMSEQE